MKSIKHSAILFLTLLFPLIINAQTDKTPKKLLGQTKQIYVEDDAFGIPKEKSIKPFLQTELAKQGFVIVDSKENAEAILLGEASVQVTLHGDSSNPPDKAIYRYRLISLNNKQLWKTTVKFVSKFSWIENNKLGAQKIAEKLFSDWQKAKKRSDK